MRLSWPSINRPQEMRAIAAALSDEDVSGIIVYGPAGVGKSELARQALSAAAAEGFDGRWVVGAATASGLPLGALAEWASPGSADTVQLLRAVIEALTAVPSGRRLLVCVDDAHLLDDLSAFVVHQIARRSSVKMLLTAADGGLPSAAVLDISKVGQFDRIDLKPFSRDQTGALMTAALGGAVDPLALQRLWTLTDGNVLYLRHIVEQEVADGRLAQRHGAWRWDGEPDMPPGLIHLVEAQMGTLASPVSDVVDVLAVGEPLELSVLGRLTCLAAVEEAETLGLVALDATAGGMLVRLTHPLYAEVRRRRAPGTRLRRFRGLIVGELARSADCDDITTDVRRATLSLDSDLTPDRGLLLRSGIGAIGLGDLSLADRLADAAGRAGAGIEANFVRAHALSWLGRGPQAEAVLAEIDTAALAATDRARLAFLRASNMLWELGEPDRAKQIIDDAPGAEGTPAGSYRDAFLAVYWFAMDRPDEASLAAKDLVVEQLPPVIGPEIAWVSTVLAADAGRTADAVRLADAGYAVAARSFDAPQMTFNIADAHLSALLLAGRVGEAVEFAERVRREAADLPGVAALLGLAVEGRALLGAGRVGVGYGLLRQAADGLVAAGHGTGWGFRYSIPGATALAMCGAATGAAAELDGLDRVRRPFRSLDYERALARAWVSAVQGAVSEAIDIAARAAERCRALGQFAAEVLCLQTVAQFGDATCASRLRDLEGIVEGPRAGLCARFAAALGTRDADELSSVSLGFESMGDISGAVDAAAHAALEHRRRSRRGSALGCSSRAVALAETCGSLFTPALQQVIEPLPLTDREREIVMLIGAGLSNRAIAGRLMLSVRTVESHVYQAMSKTGTSGRDELAALLPLAVR